MKISGILFLLSFLIQNSFASDSVSSINLNSFQNDLKSEHELWLNEEKQLSNELKRLTISVAKQEKQQNTLLKTIEEMDNTIKQKNGELIQVQTKIKEYQEKKKNINNSLEKWLTSSLDKINIMIPFKDKDRYLESLTHPPKLIQDKIDYLFENSLQLLKIGESTEFYQGQGLNRDGRMMAADFIRFGFISNIFLSKNKDVAGIYIKSTKTEKGYAPYLDLSVLLRRSIKQTFENFKNNELDNLRIPLDPSVKITKEEIPKKKRLLDIMLAGGIVMIPIILVALFALFFCLERLIMLRFLKREDALTINNILNKVSHGHWNEVQQTLSNCKKPVQKILLVGLKNKHEDKHLLEEIIQSSILEEIGSVDKYLSTIAVLANVAPLLGLLGTVTGMISTFDALTIYGTGNPKLLADGISEALITTQEAW